MRKLYLMLGLFAFSLANGRAQTILNEDFEGYQQQSATYYSANFPQGWTYEGSGVQTTCDYYTWKVECYQGKIPSMTGHGWLFMDAPTYNGDKKGGFGPRKERILTPELNLDNTYQLTFDWKASPAMVNKNKWYTLKVYAVDTQSGNETLLLDIANTESLKASGVTSFNTWEQHHSKLDLSPFQGKKVRIAFVYDMLKQCGNALWIDNVKVQQGAPLTSPKAQSSLMQYKFQKMYIGEKHYSETFTLKNVGKKGLKVTGFEAPEGVTLRADTAHINLDVNATAPMQLAYKASLTSPTSGNAVIKTNGGDITIPYTATKEAVPAGYQLELFETFPPAGWDVKGWRSSSTALEGDKSVYSSIDYDDMNLTSPRLDLSDPSAPHKVTFTYNNQFTSEEGNTLSDNEISLLISTDGGKTWKNTGWKTGNSESSIYNKLETVTVDLSQYNSNNVKLRWKNPAADLSGGTGVGEYSTFFLDRVLLPNVYGTDGVPFGVAYNSPANNKTNVFYKDVKFEWKPAQFAEDYKLYVGTASNNFDVVNGQSIGNVTSYTLANVPDGKQLFWKVVGVNSVGEETDAPLWSFTTQENKTITAFPWFEGFENNTTSMPLGWYANNVSQYSAWEINNRYPYEGKYIASTSGRAAGDTNVLYSPDVKLPASGQYQISFWWGNDQPVNLKKDPNSVRTNTFKTTDNNADYGTFEVLVDGTWKTLDRISDNSEEDQRYWVHDVFNLSEYAGKTVQFRWTYTVTNYYNSNALAIDNVEIADLNSSNVSLNKSSWSAYKVNFGKSFSSGVIAISNLGGNSVTVNSASFSTPNFTTTLAPNTTVAAGSSQTFKVTFNAGSTATADSVKVTDKLKIQLSDGSIIELPVEGIALPKDVLYYGFEEDVTGGLPQGFTGINADGTSSEGIMYWTTPNLHEGAPLSFCVLNDSECFNSLKGAYGHQALMTRCNSEGAGDDWLISQKINMTSASTLQFDARAWETEASIKPIATPKFRVLVSETSATNRSSFTQVGSDLQPSLFDGTNWTHYNIDLSAYAGKSVYVAIEAYYTNSLGGFIDNVEFGHIAGTPDGIKGINANSDTADNKPMYNTSGQRINKSYKGIVLQNGKKFVNK